MRPGFWEGRLQALAYSRLDRASALVGGASGSLGRGDRRWRSRRGQTCREAGKMPSRSEMTGIPGLWPIQAVAIEGNSERRRGRSPEDRVEGRNGALQTASQCAVWILRKPGRGWHRLRNREGAGPDGWVRATRCHFQVRQGMSAWPASEAWAWRRSPRDQCGRRERRTGVGRSGQVVGKFPGHPQKPNWPVERMVAAPADPRLPPVELAMVKILVGRPGPPDPS